MTSFDVPNSYDPYLLPGYQSVNALLPPAPVGTFRLFRLLSLYPITNVQLQTFPYPKDTALRTDDIDLDFHDSSSSSSTRRSQSTTPSAYGDNLASDACPSYDVISYAGKSSPAPEWAATAGLDGGHLDSTPNQPVVVHTIFSPSPLVQTTETVTIHITSHLLYGLLAVQEIQCPKWLFVDAICIDQLDHGDRASQVHDMGRIFRGARKVFLWLGMDMETNLSGLSSHSNGSNDSGTTTDECVKQMNGNASSSPDTNMGMGACLNHIPTLVTELDAYCNSWHLAQEHAFGNKSHNQKQQQQVQRQKKQRKLAKTSTPSSTEASLHTPSPGALQSHAHSLITTTPPALWPALERLRLNPWFTHLWAVQEVVLAQDTVLLYGHHSLPWSTYARLAALCERITSAPSSSTQHESKLVSQLQSACNGRVSMMERMRNQCLLTIADESSGRRHNSQNTKETAQAHLICLIVSMIRTADVSLPVDRVYGILGLLPPYMRECVRTDYTLPTQSQYTIKWVELFQVIIFFVPAVTEELFSYVHLQSKVSHAPTLPSWCPDLSNGKEKHSLIASSGGTSTCAGMPAGKRWSWISAGDDEEIRSVTVIPNTLKIRLLGLQVDEVFRIIDLSWIELVLNWAHIFSNSDDINPDVARDILASLWKCLELMQETGTSVHEGDAILARCVTAGGYDCNDSSGIDGGLSDDRSLSGAEKDKNMSCLTNEYISFTQYLEQHTWGVGSGSAFKQTLKATAMRFGDRFQRIARDRAFFVTKTGKPGLCSNQARQGDQVCVFMNYRVPYILRRRDDHDTTLDYGNDHAVGDINNRTFQLLGEAYVEGIMHGEAFVGGERDMVEEGPDKFVIS